MQPSIMLPHDVQLLILYYVEKLKFNDCMCELKEKKNKVQIKWEYYTDHIEYLISKNRHSDAIRLRDQLLNCKTLMSYGLDHYTI